jgi:cytosine/adenosine deaminase-related metal-dependent hydrolase
LHSDSLTIYTADYLLTPEGLKANWFLYIQNGRIIALADNVANSNIITLKGILSPGFINAHCHLELSNCKGLIPKQTGMVKFLEAVGAIRRRADTLPDSEISAYIAAQQQYAQGVDVICDISNTGLSARFQSDASVPMIRGFVELFGLNNAQAATIFENGKRILAAFQPDTAQLTPHAPYSISEKLLSLFKDYYSTANSHSPLSIHLLESEAEVALFQRKDTPFDAFFKSIGAVFKTTAPNPVSFFEHIFPANTPILWVHLTEATHFDLHKLSTLYPNSYFCLCPQANRYINNKIPDIALFLAYPDRVCIGTDSLAGNDALDLLSEISLLQTHKPFIPLTFWLKAITENPAHFLGIKSYGLIPGSQSGVVLIQNIDLKNLSILPQTTAKRITDALLK